MATRKTAAPARKSAKKPPARRPGAKKAAGKPGRGPVGKSPKPKKPKAAPPPAPGPQPEAPEALAMAKLAAEACLDKKAEDVVLLDVRGLTSYADYFVIASGGSDRQVTAIADSVEDKLKKAGHRVIGTEGYTSGHWVLIDFGDVVTHVFYDQARAFYDLEGLWADAKRVPVS